jgi:chromatin remodeling complex protein RSC6
MCDSNLKNIMGGKDTVTMFNMNRYITDHLLEKLDRSAYQHDDDEEGGGDDDTAGGGD